MRVLTVTNMYPIASNRQFGIFVKEQVESIRELGVDVDVLFINGREGRVRHKGYALGVPRLWARLLQREYDLLHAHYVFSGLLAGLQWRLPMVLTHHGVEVRDPVQGRLARLANLRARDVIVVADWMREDLHLPGAHVIPCGVNLELFRPIPRDQARQTLGLSQDKRYVLFAGHTWDPVKRFALVERAVMMVHSAHPDVELLPVGGQPHDVMPYYMNACDALVLASEWEGSPQVIKEAMACGLPVVSTDAGDAWDVIGETSGCYRASARPKDIATRLVEALSPPRRTDGPRRVARFGLHATAAAVVSVYQQALAESTPALRPNQWQDSHGAHS